MNPPRWYRRLRRLGVGYVGALIACSLAVLLPAHIVRAAEPLPPLPGRPALSPHAEGELYLRACELFHSDRLPLEHPTPHRATCGTMVLAEVASRWHQLSKATQETFAPLLFARRSASLPNSYQSPGGHFLVHYTTSGTHAVSTVDSDDNGVPDYVDSVAEVYESAWDLLTVELGYNEPPEDDDGLYDVYIRNLATESVYGLTYPEFFPSLTTQSYMEVDNNYTDGIYATRGLEGLQVTVAHEFYHAIQFGYYADVIDAAWWQELTAVWMEDVAYDDINDYYQYLPFFLDFPDASLDFNDKFGTLGLRMFGASIYAHFLDHVYGADSIRRIWESLLDRLPDDFSASDVEAGSPVGGFYSIYPRFAVWNYFTGSRARGGYYPEAANYPTCATTSVALNESFPASGGATVDRLGAVYIRIASSLYPQGVTAEFDLDVSTDWRLIVLLVTEQDVQVMYPNSHTVKIPQANRFQEIVYIPIVTGLEGDSYQFDYVINLDASVTHFSDVIGDFDGDGRTTFPDFLLFAGGFGKKATLASHDIRMDMNADGKIDFQDFLTFAAYFNQTSRP